MLSPWEGARACGTQEGTLSKWLRSFPFPAQSSLLASKHTFPADGWLPKAPESGGCVLFICTELILEVMEGSRALQRGWIPLPQRHRLLPSTCLGRTAGLWGAQVRL